MDFLLLIFVIDDIFDILLDIFLDLIKFFKNFINLFSFVIICKKLLLGLEGVQHLAEILNLHDRILFVGHQKKFLTQRVEIGEHVFGSSLKFGNFLILLLKFFKRLIHLFLIEFPATNFDF